jgi:predicted transcriptional regulator of viral defense system
MTAENYITHLLRREEFCFSWDELVRETDASVFTLRKELARLVEREALLSLRHGFYLILPPRFQPYGRLPIGLYADKLFRTLGKPYYVGLYSAAALHGAAHQKTQVDFVVTPPPVLLDVHKGNLAVRFVKCSNWPAGNLVQKSTDAGYYWISSPALTCADLIYHQSRLGGTSRTLTVLEELIPVLTESDLNALVRWYPHKSTLQRLGYWMDELESAPALSEILWDHLCSAPFYPTLLSPNTTDKPGAAHNRWKVVVNVAVESDFA